MPIKSTDFAKFTKPAQAERTPDQWAIRQLTVNWNSPMEAINAFVVLQPYISSTGEAFPEAAVSFTLEDISTLSKQDMELAHVFDSIVALVDRIAKEKGVI